MPDQRTPLSPDERDALRTAAQETADLFGAIPRLRCDPTTVLRLLAETERLREQVAAMRLVGDHLANAAYNLSRPSVTLTPAARDTLKTCQRRWDAARQAKAPPGTAEGR